MPVRLDEQLRDGGRPTWEPEPLALPLELPRVPKDDGRDEAPSEAESRVIVIDLA